jgi:hypothetical protein
MPIIPLFAEFCSFLLKIFDFFVCRCALWAGGKAGGRFVSGSGFFVGDLRGGELFVQIQHLFDEVHHVVVAGFVFWVVEINCANDDVPSIVGGWEPME